ncbi:MAG TPA: MBL fold metallo-hydrolase, partial [Dehalococcoidia bacterium]|nr:MBL fold metallo-hydrolase [Dehalococcoidia bacterium]
MARLFVATPTVRFDPDDPNEGSYILIYGDEVETSGAPDTGRIDAIYRNRTGKIDSARLSTNHPCEVYFIDAGQGDATFIVTPGFRKILVDGGRGDEAFQFLVWKYRLDIDTNPAVDIDLLVLSHTDEDHLAGLKEIVTHPRIHVRRVIHSGIAKYKSGFNTRLGERVDTAAGPVLITRHDAVTELATPNLTAGMEAWRKAIADEQTQYGAVDSTIGQINLGDPSVT